MDYKYSISKRMEIAGAHQLSLDYESRCRNLHGHNWIVTVYCRANVLNHVGMVVDFKKINTAIHSRLDHTYINDVVSVNPTAENMAAWILDRVNDELREVNKADGSDSECYKVTVQESEGNVACCTIDGGVL